MLQAPSAAGPGATGTKVLLRGPASVNFDVLMDPAEVAAARADGAAQAAEDAEAIAAAWA